MKNVPIGESSISDSLSSISLDDSRFPFAKASTEDFITNGLSAFAS